MPSLLRCSQPDCRAVPVASCFAQPQGWSFTTRHSRLLRQHVDSHRKFAAHKDQLLLLADKVRRSEEGPAAFTCQCGFSATLGKIVKHKCGGAASNTVAGAVAKRATRKRKANRKHQRRNAATFQSVLEAPASSGGQEAALKCCLEVQRTLGAPFLRFLTPASQAGRPATLPLKTNRLQVGDFIRRPSSDSYWCVKKVALETPNASSSV